MSDTGSGNQNDPSKPAPSDSKSKESSPRVSLKHRLAPLIEKLRPLAHRALRIGRVVAWITGIGLGLSVALFTAGLWWVGSYPPERMIEIVRDKTQGHFEIKKLGSLAWDNSWSSLTLRLRARDLELGDNNWSMVISELEFSLPVIKAISGKARVKAVLSSPQFVFHEKSSGTNSTKIEWQQKLREQISALQVHPRLNFVAWYWEFENGSLHWQSGASMTKLDKAKGSMFLSSWRGDVDIELDGSLDFVDESLDTKVIGPIRMSLAGNVLSETQSTRGFTVKHLAFDASQPRISTGLFFEKPNDMRAQLTLPMELEYRWDEGLKRFKVSEGLLEFDRVRAKVSGQSHGTESWQLEWAMVREQVEGLRLPIRGLTASPLTGLFHTSGRLDWRSLEGMRGTWKVTLNNTAVEAGQFPWFFDTSSRGPLRVSFVGEGELVSGQIRWPHLEMKLTGDEAQLNWNVPFVMRKPVGDRFDWIFSGQFENDELKISRMIGEVHRIKIKGDFQAQKVSRWLRGESFPFSANVVSSKTDLVQWGAYFPGLEQSAIRGDFETTFAVSGTAIPGSPMRSENLDWRVDRFHVAKLQMTLSDAESLFAWKMNGPVEGDILFSGRGRGTVVHHAKMNAQMDLTQAQVKWSDGFQKPAGTPLMFEIMGTQQQNSLMIPRGRIVLAANELRFSGKLASGAERSRLELVLDRPVELASLREFFPELRGGSLPGMARDLAGQVSWRGALSFDQPLNMDQAFDWKRIYLNGRIDLQGLRGFRLWESVPVDALDATVSFSQQGVLLPRFQLRTADQLLSASGSWLTTSQKESVSVLDFFSGKMDSGNLSVDLNRTPSFFGRMTSDRAVSGALDFDEGLRRVRAMPWFQRPLTVSFRMGPGSWGSLDVREATGRAEFGDQLWNLNPLVLAGPDGKWIGKVSVDLKDIPQLEFAARFESAPFASLISDAIAKQYFPWALPNTSGMASKTNPNGFRVSGNVNGKTSGPRWDDLLANLEYAVTTNRSQVKDRIWDQELSQWSLRLASILNEEFPNRRRISCWKGFPRVDLRLRAVGEQYEFDRLALVYDEGSEVRFSPGPISIRDSRPLSVELTHHESCLSSTLETCLRNELGVQVLKSERVETQGFHPPTDEWEKALRTCARDLREGQVDRALRDELKRSREKTGGQTNKKAPSQKIDPSTDSKRD